MRCTIRHSRSASNLTIRVRCGKGGKSTACAGASGTARGIKQRTPLREHQQGQLVETHPATAWRWVQAAIKHAEELGATAPVKRVGTHTLRSSYARHLLMNDIPINYLSRWLEHSSTQTTLIYLELVPGRLDSLTVVPLAA